MPSYPQPPRMEMYSQSNQEPKAPPLHSRREKQMVKATSNEDFANTLKEGYPHVNKETVEQILDVIYNLKIQGKKLSKKDRRIIFSKIFECSEKEARIYYTAFKIIARFQNLKDDVKRFFD